MPPNFHISPLSDEISSNIILLVAAEGACTTHADYRLTPERSTIAPLLAGRSSSNPFLVLPKTPSLTGADFSLPNAPALLGPLPTPFVQPSTDSGNQDHPLAASTVRDTVSALSAAFAKNNRDKSKAT
jgi:hypothetical protein